MTSTTRTVRSSYDRRPVARTPIAVTAVALKPLSWYSCIRNPAMRPKGG